ncbi:telomerase protein component 1 isoform X2 [Trichosurus vulpecula]|uniref:telomerase protein component 1 isoform X2 n=1 Tax=Trichosurus vulpecula TaxID=9337 RepID=UPI00186B13D3|nr:telomerase protein component 1 isoform X2 [Trichosurus vulpecula]
MKSKGLEPFGQPAILSLENRILTQPSSLQSTTSASHLLQPLQPSHLTEASLKSTDTRNYLLSQPAAGKAQDFTLGHFPKWPKRTLEATKSLESTCQSQTMKRQGLELFGQPTVLSLENSILAQPPRHLLQHLQPSHLTKPSLKCLDTTNHILSEPAACRNQHFLGGTLDHCTTYPKGTLEATKSQETWSLSREEQQQQKKEEGEEEEGKQVERAIPLYDLSLGEEMESEDLTLELAPRDSDAQHENMDQALQNKKMLLITKLCCALSSKANLLEVEDPTRKFLLQLCTDLALLEPEFILKASLYARQQLNIRDIAIMVLAVAAYLPACRPYVRRYFCAIVQLPSDWMQVAQFFQSLAGEPNRKLVPMPACLRAAMTDKFAQFDEYQLAKYNLRDHRAKKRRRRPRRPKSEKVCQRKWYNSTIVYKTFYHHQKAFMRAYYTEPVKKKPSDFTLKKLIQRLHIRDPVQNVKALLGCRYPSDLQSFSRSRLPGPWDSSRAGTRMKLPQPETWERELSQKGNKASVWEGLIDSGKLPYMAMLRNICSLLRVGISSRHHERILQLLERKESVIRSRQLPFRFLSAHTSISDLERQLRDSGPIPRNVDIMRGLLERLGKKGQIPKPQQKLTNKDLRFAMLVPVLYEHFKREKHRLTRINQWKQDREMMKRYQQALETAINLSVQHNLPPLPGRTLIVCDLGRPQDKKKNPPNHALLLVAMVMARAEQAELLLCKRHTLKKAVINPEEGILKTATELKTQIEDMAVEKSKSGDHPFATYLLDMVTKQVLIDTVIFVGDTMEFPEFVSAKQFFWQHVNPKCLFVGVDLTGTHPGSLSMNPNDVILTGCTDGILKFISERGMSRLLEHVGQMDKIFKIPPQRGEAQTPPDRPLEDRVPGLLAPAPQHSWRSVRVFISSTFLDMHGERDLLLRSVLPALQARAAHHQISVRGIDLRWGVTEEETRKDRQLELCLEEVENSQIFVGILGSRYGYVPPNYSLPDHPHFRWAKDYPSGRSVTEMEVMQFLSRGSRHQCLTPALIYLRDSSFLSSVPDAWKTDFASESEEAAERISELKSYLDKQECVTCHRYSCVWGGVAAGRPYVKGLEEFGQMVLQHVWDLLQRLYLQESGPEKTESTKNDDTVQSAFQQLQCPPSPARPSLLKDTVQKLRQHGGSLCLVIGESGQGKTAFLSSLVSALQAPCGVTMGSQVFFHFVGARPDQSYVLTLLRRLCTYLHRQLRCSRPFPTTYRGLVWELQTLLPKSAQSLRSGQTLVLVIDGADLLGDQSGQLISDWIPKILPQKVHLVMSMSANTGLGDILQCRRDAHVVALKPLEPKARAQLVRQELALYGKRLEETPFNNQMRLLLAKRGAALPLYLRLATDHLRLFTLYEQMSEQLRTLPATVPLLLQHMLGVLEQEHGSDILPLALAALHVTRSGLTLDQLHGVISTWRALPLETVDWAEAMAAKKKGDPYPMGPFTYLVRSLRSLLGEGSLELPGARLRLPPGPLSSAAELRYRKRPVLKTTAHVLIAVQLWRMCDPDALGTFRNCHPEALNDLPYHLVQSGNHSLLASLLTNLNVMATYLELGLLSQLGEAHALYESSAPVDELTPSEPDVATFHIFLKQQSKLLTQYPALLAQQATNQPSDSPICHQAPKLAQQWSSQPILHWLNKPQTMGAQQSSSLSLVPPSTPTAVGLSPNGQRAVVATASGIVHLLDTCTWQEEKSIVSGCDGIASCLCPSNTTVFLTAMDGLLELWDLQGGWRVFQTKAHQLQITDCCLNPDRRLLATVSLDRHLKLWDTVHGKLAAQHLSQKPLNSVAFHPEGQVIITGNWAGRLSVLRLDSLRVTMELGGSGSSVRAVAFAPTGSVLAASHLDGTVELWAWQKGARLAAFPAHQGYATSALFLQSGRQLLTAGEDGKVQVWSGFLGRPKGDLGSLPLSPALSVAISPDRAHVAVGHHTDGIRIYSTSSGTEEDRCPVSDVAVSALAWLNHRVLVSGGEDGNLQCWVLGDVTPHCLWLLPAHQKAVLGLASSQELFASASEDFTVRLWSLPFLTQPEMAEELHPGTELRGHTGPVTCCSFSPDGGILATGSRDQSLLCWDVRTPEAPVLMYSLPACHRDWITGCSWTNDAMLLSCSNDGSVRLWDPVSGQQLGQFLGHQSAVSTVVAVEEHVVSVDRDGALKVWDLQGVELTSIPAHSGPISHCVATQEPRAAGQPGTEILVVTAGLDGATRLWHPLLVFQTHTLLGHSGPIISAAASETLGLLLTASKDGSVRLWHVPEKVDEVGAGERPTAITAVAWAPDGSLAVSGSQAGELILWQEAKAVARAQAPGRVSALCWTSPQTFFALINDKNLSKWQVKKKGIIPNIISLGYALQLNLEDSNTLLSGMDLAPDSSSLILAKPLLGMLLLNLDSPVSEPWYKFPLNTYSMFSTHKEYGVFVLDTLGDISLSVYRQKESNVLEHIQNFNLQLENPRGTPLWITQAKPESDLAFLCTSSEGVLWNMAERLPEGDWDTNNIWQSNIRQDTDEELEFRKLETRYSKKIHAGSVTALHVLPELLLTASEDRDVKLWERPNLQLRGLFRCEGAVSCVEPRPGPMSNLQLAVGDAQGHVYFLSWE